MPNTPVSMDVNRCGGEVVGEGGGGGQSVCVEVAMQPKVQCHKWGGGWGCKNLVLPADTSVAKLCATP